MTRKEKYPDTETFRFFNANPKGRLTGDCKYRAICTALEIPYNQVVMEMAELQCETGYAADTLIDRYLKSKGWVKKSQPRKYDNTRYTGEEFCKQVQMNRHLYDPAIIANIGTGHIVAIMYGKVYDTWDSTDGCIGNYWERKRS